jgi:hypothetical protein
MDSATGGGGISENSDEQLRCQLHYHWAKATPQDRIAYLEDLILKLELLNFTHPHPLLSATY